MLNLSLINKNVSTLLKDENNEVVYAAWLSFVENAELDNDNIIISVPNHFTKNILEERYLSDIESLYRAQVDFGKIVIKVSLNDNETSIESTSDSFLIQVDDLIEIVNAQVEKIYEFINTASTNGNTSISYVLDSGYTNKTEIGWRIKDFMLNKGFKAELSNLDDVNILNISWHSQSLFSKQISL